MPLVDFLRRLSATGIVVCACLLAWTGHHTAARDPQPGPDPADDAEPVPPLQAWADTIKDRPIGTLDGETGATGAAAQPVRRTCLRVTATYLWYVRLDWPAEALQPRKPEPDDRPRGDESGERRKKPPPPAPQPLRRVLCRQAIPEPGAEPAAPQEVLDLGAYPHAFIVSADGSQLVVARQTEDTDGDGTVTRADARTLWASATDPGGADVPQFQQVHTGSPQMVLCSILSRAGDALVTEPGESPFANRILRVPLMAGAAPAELTTGMWVECVTPDESHAVIARVGELRDESFNPWGRRGQPRGIAEGEGDAFAIARPPIHVLIPLQGQQEPETVLLPGEDWSRVVHISADKLWLETLLMPPQYTDHRDHPSRQTRNMLAWMELENLTRVPVTSDPQFDNQFVGEVPGRGVLYLHNTNINRYLKVYNGSDQHVVVRELSPLTPEFVLSPDGRRLWFLEYTAERGPFHPLLTPTRIRWLPLTRD